MIRQIRGKVLEVGVAHAVIEVAGLGVLVRMNAPEALSIGGEAKLATHLAVKKDGVDMYGFVDAADRDFFELIISVSGIGPKTAMSILRRASREALEVWAGYLKKISYVVLCNFYEDVIACYLR